MSTGQTMDAATEELFSALHDYTYCRSATATTECLAKMERALTAGADWRAALGPGARDAAMYAALQPDSRPVELMLRRGIPLEHFDDFGYSLLHHAAHFGRLEVVRFLIEAGLPFDLKARDGKTTPLAKARSWKHGQEAVAYLRELTSQKQAAGKLAARGAGRSSVSATGFCAETLLAALQKIRSAALRAALTEFALAFFAEEGDQHARDFLLGVANQDNEALLAPALAATARLCTGEACSRPGLEIEELVHIGDLTLSGHCVPRILLVTGNLAVTGRLANYEGCIVAAGGNISAEAIWSEGPFVAGGHVTTRNGFVGSGNDYKTSIGGTLVAPVLVKENHVIRAKTTEAGQLYDKWEKVPAAIRPALLPEAS